MKQKRLPKQQGPELGKRYRVDQPGNRYDGLCGSLEHIHGTDGWIMRGNVLVRTPLACLREQGVLQGVRVDLVRQADEIKALQTEIDEVIC